MFPTLNSHDQHFDSMWSDCHDRMWHHQVRSGQVMPISVCESLSNRKKRGFMILEPRNALSLRSCETPPTLWITFRKAITTQPGSSRVMCQGKWLVSVDSTLSNLYTTLTPQPSWEPCSLAAGFKGLCPHRKRPADVSDQSIESHCWRWKYQGAIFYWCEPREKLPPGSAVAV